MNTLLALGYGYSAQALAQQLLATGGWQILGVTRNRNKVDDIKSHGITPLLWEKKSKNSALKTALASATHILVSAPPDEDGDPFLNILTNDLKITQPEWVGYLSTTGVYGDHQGGWVNEATPLAPTTKRGKLRVLAEKQWQETGLPLHIFRLAAIYGPGREPFKKVQSEHARLIIKPNQYFSRIHVHDIAQVLIASIENRNPGQIYNLCDDNPAPPQDVLSYAAKLLNLPVPPAITFEYADLSPMARSFYAESKRVRNTRIKTELGVKLLYPTYHEGLASLLHNSQHSPSS